MNAKLQGHALSFISRFVRFQLPSASETDSPGSSTRDHAPGHASESTGAVAGSNATHICFGPGSLRPSSIADPQTQIWCCHRIKTDANAQTRRRPLKRAPVLRSIASDPAKSLSPIPESGASAIAKIYCAAVPPASPRPATESPAFAKSSAADPSSRSE